MLECALFLFCFFFFLRKINSIFRVLHTETTFANIDHERRYSASLRTSFITAYRWRCLMFQHNIYPSAEAQLPIFEDAGATEWLVFNEMHYIFLLYFYCLFLLIETFCCSLLTHSYRTQILWCFILTIYRMKVYVYMSMWVCMSVYA